MPDIILVELEAIFAYLNKSRHLPSYRLEPHAAPFFAISLSQILSDYLKVEIHKTIVPEFPFRKGTIKHSVKIKTKPIIQG